MHDADPSAVRATSVKMKLRAFLPGPEWYDATTRPFARPPANWRLPHRDAGPYWGDSGALTLTLSTVTTIGLARRCAAAHVDNMGQSLRRLGLSRGTGQPQPSLSGQWA
jgi:hypothetical protein